MSKKVINLIGADHLVRDFDWMKYLAWHLEQRGFDASVVINLIENVQKGNNPGSPGFKKAEEIVFQGVDFLIVCMSDEFFNSVGYEFLTNFMDKTEVRAKVIVAIVGPITRNVSPLFLGLPTINFQNLPQQFTQQLLQNLTESLMNQGEK